MTIMGACLVAIGLLVVIWGVIETHGVDMTNLDFLSFFTGGIIVMVLGMCLIPALPPVGKVVGTAAPQPVAERDNLVVGEIGRRVLHAEDVAARCVRDFLGNCLCVACGG